MVYEYKIQELNSYGVTYDWFSFLCGLNTVLLLHFWLEKYFMCFKDSYQTPTSTLNEQDCQSGDEFTYLVGNTPK